MLVQSLPIEILEVSHDLVLDAAHIKANHPLSDVDAFAVATAMKEKAIVLTGDPEFESVEMLVTVEWLVSASRGVGRGIAQGLGNG